MQPVERIDLQKASRTGPPATQQAPFQASDACCGSGPGQGKGLGARCGCAGGRWASLLICLAAIGALSFQLGTCSFAIVAKDDEPDYPDLFDHVQFYLHNYYLDLGRAQPVYLLRRALSSMENAAEEIYVENSDPEKPFVGIHAGDKYIIRSLSRVQTIENALDLLKDIFVFLKNNYRGKSSLNEIRYATVNGFLSGLDPHTMVFSPKAFKDFSVHIEGEIVGVGMLVGSREGKLNVEKVLKETPAEKAGFRPKDVILKIGEESTVNMTVSEAVQRIRGLRNTTIDLTVRRRESPGSDKMETRKISVTRDRVLIVSVKSKLVPDNIGYVQVSNYDKNTVDSLKEHILKLQKESGPKGLSGFILDLRNNSGGLLKQAAEMADLFLKTGELYFIADKKEVSPTEAENDGDEPDFPMVVLCNQGSASGAEIVIGALQRNHRAVVLGSTTFGKGSVQQLHPLKYDAQIKITVSEYLIPDKISIQENGVVPDILADRIEFTKKAVDLFPDTHLGREKDYERHIVSKYARAQEPAEKIQFPYISPDDSPDASDLFYSDDIKPMEDSLVKIGHQLLGIAIQERKSDKPGEKAAGAFQSEEFLARNKAGIESIRKEQFQSIVALLKGRGIDWSIPDAGVEKLDAKPALEVSLSHEIITREQTSKETDKGIDKEKALQNDSDDPYPEKVLLLKAKATNRSDKTLYRVNGITDADYFAYNEQEFLFGKLEPGQTIERTVEISLRPVSASRNDVFSVQVRSQGYDGWTAQAKHEVLLLSEEFPDFNYALNLFDGKTGAAITRLAPGMDAVLKARVSNITREPLKKGVILLKNDQRKDVFLEVGRLVIDELMPGEHKEVEFKFQVREDSKEEAYKFEFGIVSAHFVTGLSREFEIPSSRSEAGEFRNNQELKNPSLALKPMIGGKELTGTEALVTDQDAVDVCAMVQDEHQGFQAWIATALLSIHEEENPDKIFFIKSRDAQKDKDAAAPQDPAAGAKGCSFESRVPLKIGQNVISVVVTDDLGLSRRKLLFLRREPVKTVKGEK